VSGATRGVSIVVRTSAAAARFEDYGCLNFFVEICISARKFSS
jgi:hypothetical protein